MVHFQTLPNAFEIFGVDWMVDEGGRAWLLEVNAFPDFGRSGVEGEGVVRGVWEGVVGMVGGFFGVGVEGRGEAEEERSGMRKVLDIDLGRR
jgi:tubulin--tyrosine ligase